MGIWQFQWENWDQLNIHCNRKDLKISMDITANLATSRYYLCLKLQLHCMKAQKGGGRNIKWIQDNNFKLNILVLSCIHFLFLPHL